jgi:hypothetical protein
MMMPTLICVMPYPRAAKGKRHYTGHRTGCNGRSGNEFRQ